MLPLRLIAPVLIALIASASPTVVRRGELARIAISPTTINNCLAHVQYADESGVNLPIKYPENGHVSWTFRVPAKAPLGVAHWSVRCGVLYETGGSWLIVPAGVTVGPKPPPPVVSKQGFSQRAEAFGTASTVSYGFLIRNPALKKDAHDVSVTVSFASADGTMIGRKTMTVARIGAGETFALGGSTELSSQVAAKNMTASLRVHSYTTATNKPRPRVGSARIVANNADPGWVDEVDGEIVNDASQQTLYHAGISVVVLDTGGRIVGGGTGALSRPLASGARGPFAAKLGFAAIPIGDAARPVVSVVPAYR